jgi:hypothetical protein
LRFAREAIVRSLRSARRPLAGDRSSRKAAESRLAVVVSAITEVYWRVLRA